MPKPQCKAIGQPAADLHGGTLHTTLRRFERPPMIVLAMAVYLQPTTLCSRIAQVDVEPFAGIGEIFAQDQE